MVHLLSLLVLSLFLALPAAAQTASEKAGVVVLGDGWKAARGDSAAWAGPAYDDRAWTPLAVEAPWEDAFPDYDGTA